MRSDKAWAAVQTLGDFGRPSCWLKLNCCDEFGGKCSVKQGQLKKPVLSALPAFYTQPATITVVFHDGWRYKAAKPPPPPASSPPSKLADLPASTAPLIHLRDGEVVLYRVSRSSRWQARIRLLTPKWIRFSTRQRNQIDAARVACERYDEARYRERLGLAPTLKRFEDIARECIERGTRTKACATYASGYQAKQGPRWLIAKH